MTATATAPEILLTPEQLAERWQVATGTLENQRVRKEGPPYIKLGGGRSAPVRYRLADVIEYENNNTKELPP